VRISHSIRNSLLIFTLLLTTCLDGSAQISRVGAGFAFSDPVDFNYGETGNPGLVVKTWITLNKASTFHVFLL